MPEEMRMKRNAILISSVIMALLLGAFLLNSSWLFGKKDGNAPVIVLPEQGEDFDLPPDIRQDNRQLAQAVEVTRENVQQVVGVLKRPDEYSYSARVTYYYSSGSHTVETKGYYRDEMTKTIQYTASGQVEKEAILTKEKAYIWAGNSGAFYMGNRGEFDSDSLSLIPTYEDVLTLQQDSVLDGGFYRQDDTECIYIAVKNPVSGYTDIYYVSVDSGLLIASQSYSGSDNLVYEMSMQSLSLEPVGDETFLLPNGASVIE